MIPGEDHDFPDFRWPDRFTELLLERLSDLWESLTDYAAAQVRHPTFLGWAQMLIALAGIAYLAILWACFCYIRFPVSPYGIWNIIEWVVLAGAVVWGAIVVFFGGAQLLELLCLILLTAVYAILSLVYLCWSALKAHRRQSAWLKRYRVVMIFGMTAALTAATFVDGAYRFWDAPFAVLRWLKFAIAGASAWAALFCYLMRGNLGHRCTPRRIVTWTVVLTLAVGVIVHWLSNQDREEYFMRKNVAQRPNDPTAWLDLAWHYEDQGDALTSEEGDEGHQPPDPQPYYEQALDSINRAIGLGAAGFEVHFSRAKLADAIGQAQKAVSFARDALGIAPVNPTAEGKDHVNWLQEMMARNISALPMFQAKERRETERRRVRDRRRQHIPWIVGWVFASPET